MWWLCASYNLQARIQKYKTLLSLPIAHWPLHLHTVWDAGPALVQRQECTRYEKPLPGSFCPPAPGPAVHQLRVCLLIASSRVVRVHTGTSLSRFVRAYSMYLEAKIKAQRALGYDVCHVKAKYASNRGGSGGRCSASSHHPSFLSAGAKPSFCKATPHLW
jgi:hypothetical protein